MPESKRHLYVRSEVDLPGNKRVGPGVLAELDITDDQAKSLPKSVLRAATADEIEAAEQRAAKRRAEQQTGGGKK